MQPNRNSQLLIVIICICLSKVASGQSAFDRLKVGTTPILLFPYAFDGNKMNWNNWFCNNETEFYYTTFRYGRSLLAKRTFIEGHLGKEEILELNMNSNFSHPWVSEDGSRIMFQASLTLDGKDEPRVDIWYALKTADGWSMPEMLESLSSQRAHEGAPVETDLGNIYFNATQDGSTNADIHVLNNADNRITKLPPQINSEGFERDFYIDSKEKFIIFSSFDRPDGLGQSDLYISFNQNGKWSEAVSLGNEINSPGEDFSPYLSKDRRHLIFSSSRESGNALRPSFRSYIVRFDLDSYRN